MIKLKCSVCHYSYEVSEQEIFDNPQYHNNCLCCGAKNEVENIEELIHNDIFERVEQYINKSVAKIGWDLTLDLIKRNKTQACYRIYKEILAKKGFNLKED